MRRGEIWTVAGGPDYTGKPRPTVIVQSDDFDATLSVTICPFTSDAVETVFARLAVAPTESNRLQVRSFVMVDKMSTVPRSKIGRRIGRLDRKDMALLDQRIALFLGLAG